MMLAFKWARSWLSSRSCACRSEAIVVRITVCSIAVRKKMGWHKGTGVGVTDGFEKSQYTKTRNLLIA